MVIYCVFWKCIWCMWIQWTVSVISCECLLYILIVTVIFLMCLYMRSWCVMWIVMYIWSELVNICHMLYIYSWSEISVCSAIMWLIPCIATQQHTYLYIKSWCVMWVVIYILKWISEYICIMMYIYCWVNYQYAVWSCGSYNA